MALVPAEEHYSTMSNTSQSQIRGREATELARRRLRGVMNQKERQCEQLRQTLERRKRQLEAEKAEMKQLETQKEELEEDIARLKEEKVYFRVFKGLDKEKKNCLSVKNIVEGVSCNPDEELYLEEAFKQIPTSFFVTLRAQDLSVESLRGLLVERTGFPDTAIELEEVESQAHGIVKIWVRVAWHSHPPEIADHPDLPEEENEERLKLKAQYYQALGGSESQVEPEQAKAAEQKLTETLRAHAGELGCEVVRITEEHRANFSDFMYNICAGGKDAIESLGAELQKAHRIEETTILPEEALDKVTELEHQIRHQQKLNAEKRRDMALTEKDIQSVDKQIDEVSRELQHIQRVTGYNSSQRSKEHVDFSLQEAQIEGLEQLVKRLRDEHKQGTSLLSKRTQVIVSLSQIVEEKSEFEEQVYKAINDYNVVQAEIEQIKEQIRIINMDHAKTDRAIVAIEGSRDIGALESLRSDKKYLEFQISQHKEAKGQTDRTIEAQKDYLNMLERRHETVKAALKDLKLERRIQAHLKDALTQMPDSSERDPYNAEQIMQNQTVDVELYELLVEDHSAIMHSKKMKEIILLEKEETIDADNKALIELQEENIEDSKYYSYATRRDEIEVQRLREQQRRLVTAQRHERNALRRGIRDQRKTALQKVASEA